MTVIMRAFKFVRFIDVEASEPAHHEHYGIVLKWICDCEIPGTKP
jgi:hypothetical protein